MQVLQRQCHALEAGRLYLTLTAGEENLFQIAERINPKRAFLFVSTILGRHIPVDPREHRAALWRLAAQVEPHLGSGPVLVMGFAETAIGIGAGLYDCLREQNPDRFLSYLCTTRFKPRDAAVWFTIEEAHSHAVDHIILDPGADFVKQGLGATLVLVDDETTTGKTFHQLADGLSRQGLHFNHIVLATLTDWSAGTAEDSVRGIFGEAKVRAVSLLSGTWQWTPDPSADIKSLPAGRSQECPLWAPSLDQVFAAPRGGLSTTSMEESPDEILSRLQGAGLRPFAPDDKVLIIGAGEHVWMPMRLAEAIAASGLHTRFITTTRSPILQGRTIRTKTCFSDHYGAGFEMYMHNVHSDEWDRIILCTETTTAGIPSDLIHYLGCVDIVDGSGSVLHKISSEAAA